MCPFLLFNSYVMKFCFTIYSILFYELFNEDVGTSGLEFGNDPANDSSNCIGFSDTQGEDTNAIITGKEAAPQG